MNQEEFIKKSKIKHGEKYDYSLVDYKNGKEKVDIICKEHGIFTQTPESHLQGCGCNHCAIILRAQKRKLTTTTFIERAKIKHGDKYIYSQTEYINSKEHVNIICKEHGIFSQVPATHLSGHGCPLCSIITVATKRNKDTDYFIIKACEKHNNKYTYEKSEYINNRSLIIINCKEHGDFTQKANAHLNGLGCSKCSGQFMDNEYFVEKSNKIHGNKYTYEKAVYLNNSTKICITCKEHGDFYQQPNTHISGGGCQKCAGAFMDLDYFIEKSNKIHDYKYDYTKSIYIANDTNLSIICSKHGEFQQTPHSHLSGAGCPICRESVGERTIRKYLNSKNIKHIHQHKFDDCKHKRKLPFDFYLPEHNFCIEYDGIQHFSPSDFFGGEEAYQSLKMRDGIKTNYCIDKNIKLIRIPYTDLDNIHNILNENLFI